MSSHHIVREKQEPALLILSLDNFSDELLGQLLEWSPTIIVTPDVAEKLQAFCIKIDHVLTNGSAMQPQSDVNLLPVGEDTETIAGLEYLIEQDYSAVNIITDVLELNEYLIYIDKIDIVVFHHNLKIYAISSGFRKWKPAGENIHIISQPIQLDTEGLMQVEPYKFVTLQDGFFSLKFDQPYLFIAEEI
jgi:thiamine pyrophosphokinase